MHGHPSRPYLHTATPPVTSSSSLSTAPGSHINHVYMSVPAERTNNYLTFQPFTLHFFLPATPRLAVTVPIVGRRANSTAINSEVSRMPRPS